MALELRRDGSNNSLHDTARPELTGATAGTREGKIQSSPALWFRLCMWNQTVRSHGVSSRGLRNPAGHQSEAVFALVAHTRSIYTCAV